MKLDASKTVSIEDQIILATLNGLFDAGYRVAVFDGEEFVTKRTANKDQVDYLLKQMKGSDEDYLMAYKKDPEGGAGRAGWVRMVYGNDDWEVICDYTVSLDAVMNPINAAIDEYSGAL